MPGQTVITIEGDRFFVDGRVTYPGTSIEGRLMNSRMVQATFDDLNPQTRARWDYPDGPWDAERNVRSFIDALPAYRRHGLLAVTTNFQGGNPIAYSQDQPWHNSAFDSDGHMREDYADRMGRVIDAADALGMVVILGFFYFGQDQRLHEERAVVRACDETTDWLLARGDRNVLVEIANEADLPKYDHAILRLERGTELIRRVQERSTGRVNNAAQRLLVSTSQSGGQVLDERIAGVVDFVLLHGNSVKRPARMREMIAQSRAVHGYHGQPIVINEDDHYDFDQPDHNMRAAVESGASWGYFDYRRDGEGFTEGYQSVPVDWAISSPRKQAFFERVKRLSEGG